MVLTPSSMVPLGTQAPDFALPDTEGNTVSRTDFVGQPLAVLFICNHCPYVKHIADALGPVTDQMMGIGVAVVGISSNDIQHYPDDAPERMAEEKTTRGWPFPYLFDETQDVARAYDAKCTPDLYLFDEDHKLVYRGQFDDSRPGNGKPVTGATLLAAARAVIGGGKMPPQVPSIGCNIKWKP